MTRHWSTAEIILYVVDYLARLNVKSYRTQAYSKWHTHWWHRESYQYGEGMSSSTIFYAVVERVWNEHSNFLWSHAITRTNACCRTAMQTGIKNTFAVDTQQPNRDLWNSPIRIGLHSEQSQVVDTCCDIDNAMRQYAMVLSINMRPDVLK